MLARHLALASLPFLFTLAGCGSSSSSSPTSTVPPAGNAPTEAKSSLTQDDVSTLPAGAITDAVTANNAFAVDLYAHVLSTTSAGNVLTSPISASLALTMTYAGAEGETATQMASALHLATDVANVFDGQNALSQALGSRAAAALAYDQKQVSQGGGGAAPAPSATDYALQTVNSVWGQKTYPWAEPFLDTLAKSYGAGVYLEDFVNQPEPARTAINDWVSQQTADKITDLLPEGSIDGSTRLVLVNAIHLKLPWANAFDASATQPATFTKADGTTAQTPFMNETQTLPYVDDGQAQVVGLPLAGQQLALVIALPHGDLATYEASLTPTSAALSVPAASNQVALSLPKFTFTSPSISLATELQAMGMTDAFDATKADFTGMCATTPDGDHLYIGDVLQKATIAVQETGVEAAAATAVLTVGAAIANPMPVSLTLDKPFVVSIIDVPTGAVLFLGHIADPTDAGGT